MKIIEGRLKNTEDTLYVCQVCGEVIKTPLIITRQTIHKGKVETKTVLMCDTFKCYTGLILILLHGTSN